jgi:hypothetical protein
MSNAKDSRESQPLMHIHNLYADENGETHFRDINIEPATEGPVGKVSGRFPATGVVFRTTDGSYNYGWHTAPQKQYVINLDAVVKVTQAKYSWSRIRAARDTSHGRLTASFGIRSSSRSTELIDGSLAGYRGWHRSVKC